MKQLNPKRLQILFIALAWSANVIASQELLHSVKGQPVAAEFDLLDIDGKHHILSQHRGKVVIINFWASWCPPCRFELPAMEKAWQKLKNKGVVMLGINVGEDADTIFSFTTDYPVTFPLLMDIDSAVIQKYPVIGLPTTFVIGPEGKLVYRAIGTREWDENNMVKKVLRLRQK